MNYQKYLTKSPSNRPRTPGTKSVYTALTKMRRKGNSTRSPEALTNIRIKSDFDFPTEVPETAILASES